MKDMNSGFTTERHGAVRPLILTRRTAIPGPDTPILLQETCLELTNDQSHLVLRRYFERFSPAEAHWVEYIHSIPTAELVHWIMTHGQLRIECSDNTPHSHVYA
jgi:hypothetical protein